MIPVQCIFNVQCHENEPYNDKNCDVFNIRIRIILNLEWTRNCSAQHSLVSNAVVCPSVSRRGMGSVADFKPPTMSDLPIPQGAWKDAHSAKQRKNNLHLVSGLLVSGGTLAFVSFVWCTQKLLPLFTKKLNIHNILHY